MDEMDAATAHSPINNSRGFYLLDPNSVENITRPLSSDSEDDEDFGPTLEKSIGVLHDVSPGVLPNDVYDLALPWWRSGVRRFLVKNLKQESAWIAALQKRVRTDWLDTYFVYTSTLGTHTFFMTLLPAFFFFGHATTGRGLVIVLSMGVYWSSFLKDLVCSPRPYVPPVTRLTVGFHHLEYGFPSTHSTNSTSIALYIHTLIYRLYLSDTISSMTLYLFQALIAWYIFSIVFGRLYCGMHSFSDCAVGVILGATVWAIYWATEDIIETWISTTGWSAPVTLIVLAIIMINKHPQPVDDCPCFEDSIAFVSSILGVLLGEWHTVRFALLENKNSSGGGEWTSWTVWLGFATLKLFFGILIIFIWRLVAKALFHAILPPTFRFAALIFTLPNRRFYTPATDYVRVPSERGLHPIPSVISLPLSHDTTSQASATLPRFGGEGLKSRGGNGNAGGGKHSGKELQKKHSFNIIVDNPGNDVSDEPEARRKHYDADVMTKAMVYVGIGVIAAEVGPVVFEYIGWSGISR